MTSLLVACVILSFLSCELCEKKSQGCNQSLWLHTRVTATLISYAIQGELKIDLFSLCRIKLLPSINHALHYGDVHTDQKSPILDQ